MSYRRLLFLDVLRGFFILYVVFLHALNGVVYGNNPQALNEAPVWLLILFSPLAILGTWAPIFVVISGAAHAYVLHGVLSGSGQAPGRGPSFRAFTAGAIATSASLYLLSLLNMVFMHHSMFFNGAFRHTLFTSSLQQGRWLPFDSNLLYYNDALSMVAVNGLLVNLVLYMVWRGNGFKYMRRAIYTIAALACAVFLLSPFIHYVLNPWFFYALDHQRYGVAFLFKLVVGPNLSPMPYAAYGLVGAIIGIALAGRVSAGSLRRYGYGLAALFVSCGAVLMISQGFTLAELVNHPFPLKMHCLNLGLMLACCTWLILHFEYCTEEQRGRLARRTLWLRRVGLTALTLFCLESFGAVLFSKAYMWIWGMEGSFPRSPFHVVLFLVFVLAFWNVLLYFWEKVNFKYSVEWWVSRLVCFVRARPTVRLQAGEVLHKPCEVAPPASKPLPVPAK